MCKRCPVNKNVLPLLGPLFLGWLQGVASFCNWLSPAEFELLNASVVQVHTVFLVVDVPGTQPSMLKGNF